MEIPHLILAVNLLQKNNIIICDIKNKIVDINLQNLDLKSLINKIELQILYKLDNRDAKQ